MIGINGKVAPSKPNQDIMVNGGHWREPMTLNGLVPTNISINGLERPPVLAGCVLYTPLWHPALGGATFNDLAGANLCTVTGTTWGSRGRTGDGDDLIALPAITITTANIFSISVWVNGTDSPAEAKAIFGAANAAAFGYPLLQWNTDNTVRFSGHASDAYIVSAAALTPSDWHLVTVTSNGVNRTLYVDNAAPVTDALGNNTDWGVTAKYLFCTENAGVKTRFLSGSIGDAWINDGVTTQGEHNRMLQATKWRYS